MKIFVLMPFLEDFDDVYHIIKDSVESVTISTGINLECVRADEIDAPGKISDQILISIAECDLIVAELTGGNPNVMYELGYAHALEKPAIILNQAVHESPFDVKDYRQITYDRSRLLKDCRPSLIAAILSVIEKEDSTNNEHVIESEITELSQPNEEFDDAKYIRPGSGLTNELQRIYLELQFLNTTGDKNEILTEAEKLINLLGRVTVIGNKTTDSLKTAAGVAGNCAVELEKANYQDRAEKVYRKILGLYPEHSGVHMQYADLLCDLGRYDEAIDELDRSRNINPNDSRLSQLEMKIALSSGRAPDELGKTMAENFESDPSDKRKAAAYLTYLSQTDNEKAFRAACEEWRKASKCPYEPKRALADYLASSSDDTKMKEAISVYQEIQNICPNKDRVALMHNLATLLYHFDDDDAQKIWQDAYLIEPGNTAIQSAFSQLLSRKGDIISARKVSRGEPL